MTDLTQPLLVEEYGTCTVTITVTGKIGNEEVAFNSQMPSTQSWQVTHDFMKIGLAEFQRQFDEQTKCPFRPERTEVAPLDGSIAEVAARFPGWSPTPAMIGFARAVLTLSPQTLPAPGEVLAWRYTRPNKLYPALPGHVVVEAPENRWDNVRSWTETPLYALATVAAANDEGVAKPRPFHEWHEDKGPVLWWLWPITEEPYVGSPLDLGRTVSFNLNVQVGIDLYEVEPKAVGMTGGWPWAGCDEETEARLFWTPLPCASALDTAIRDHIRGGPEDEA